MADASPDNLICRPQPPSQIRGQQALLARAPAKLNLALRVVGVRDDGFHEIESVAAKVSLYDELLFRLRPDGQIELRCEGLPCGPPADNIVLQAASRLRTGRCGADITLTKRIPAASGLGGGSSDAAAALIALNRLWGCGLARPALASIAAELGSDVPLFLTGPAAVVRGRGERVEPVRVHRFWALLYVPELGCPTGEVYAAYDGLAGAAPAPARIDPARFARLPSQWGQAVCNDLRPAAERVRPALAAEARRLEQATGMAVHLTGSGSGLFVLTDARAAAERAAAACSDDLRARCRIVALNGW